MFVIITPTYNSEKYIEQCIRSVHKQILKDYIHIIIDDCSTDNTNKIIKETLSELKDEKTTLLRTNARGGPLSSHIIGTDFYRDSLKDTDIVVHLDGDDWFKSEDSLDIIKDVYDREDCYATYGSYEPTDINFPNVNQDLPKDLTFREQAKRQWVFSHTRTFKYFLWKQLTEDDFTDSNGKLYTSAADVAIFLPILEMAGRDKVKHIRYITYVYNRDTMNEDKENINGQINCARDIFSKQPKEVINESIIS